jgi:iron(III) transport system substrate-binding protein
MLFVAVVESHPISPGKEFYEHLMQIKTMNPTRLFFILLLCLITTTASAQTSTALSNAKRDADARGYVFAGSHDEIVNNAKREGRLNVVASLSQEILTPMNEAFRKKYPFIDSRVVGVRGNEVYVRLLEELKAGLTKNQDVNDLVADYYTDYLPYQKKIDIFAMAKEKVLDIPPAMVDPINRNVVAVGSSVHILAYNKKLIPSEKVPNTWEDFLKPEFKGEKFMLGIRPLDLQSLVPAWGLEKTLDYARKMAAQKPVWSRGGTAGLAQLLAAEHALLVGPHLDSFLRAKDKDKTDMLGYKLLEPLPVRLNEGQGILNRAEYPYAALLWLEFLVSREGQKLLDQYGPYEASVFVSGTIQEQAIRGKKLSVVDWSHYVKTPEYQRRIVEAYGFPRADSPASK